ncbi:MAG TPA: dihydrodipicolinate synthase family protein [Gemmatimonadales bacterium]|jgi:4-hydroxy-tetrahydrodipicolinate synthase|nr:dihydrodipicolinate synthase family protein [Gemmatimonadales bacterium]
MQQHDWAGVFPAITTPFGSDGEIDAPALAAHVGWLADAGCRGIVALGSLGEGATLRADEKVRVLQVCREALSGRLPLIAGISGLSTEECVALARAAERVGCTGLMVLPPYVYRGDWPETEAHFTAVLGATSLSCMLYNNPIAYGTDLLADDVARLAERHRNVHAVKESSGDVRRVTALRTTLGNRLQLFAGLDDMIVEAAAMGAHGWVAGLVNAFPVESVRLFELARAGRGEEVRRLYDWFLPLLRFDTVPKFVQLIKLAQAEVGKGSERVRPPRLALAGAERAAVLGVLHRQLSVRPLL